MKRKKHCDLSSQIKKTKKKDTSKDDTVGGCGRVNKFLKWRIGSSKDAAKKKRIEK